MTATEMSTSTGMDSYHKEKCWISQKTRFTDTSGNSTSVSFNLIGGYEGIPEVMMLNVVAFIALTILFSFLRRKAWNYGQMALLNPSNQTERAANQADVSGGYQMHGGPSVDSFVNVSKEIHDDNSLFSWISILIKLKDNHFLHKCGPDALQYFNFQRIIMAYLVVLCVISVCVTMPVNFQGRYTSPRQNFGHTTLSNLEPWSDLLWVHCLLSVLYMVFAVWLMRFFASKIKSTKDEDVSATLMISNIKLSIETDGVRQTEADLSDYFRTSFGDYPVQRIFFAYNVSKLAELLRQRQNVSDALQRIEASGTNPSIRPFGCGRICPFGRQTDALSFYTAELERLRILCEDERNSLDQMPMPIAFVCFDNHEDAVKIRNCFRRYPCLGTPVQLSLIPITPVGDKLDVSHWTVTLAPSADGVCWENLTTDRYMWYLRSAAINFLLFVVLFFLTTPSMFLHAWYKLKGLEQGSLEQVSTGVSVLKEFLPILVLLIFASLLPPIVYWAEYHTGHWTKASENMAIMWKTFLFLLFMVLILPSLGLMSGNQFLEYFLSGSKFSVRWSCFFMPENAAFFVSFVATNAFLGNALELLRFSQLVYYAFQILMSRSKFEVYQAQWASTYDFSYGWQYAWMMTLFCITLVYSLSCPVIVPFGLLYFIVKHYIDKYNLYFVYTPSEISRAMHRSAISFVLLSCNLCQILMLFFIVIRSESGLKQEKAVFMLAVTICGLVVFFGHFLWGWFSGMSDSAYQHLLGSDSTFSWLEETAPINGDIAKAAEPENHSMRSSSFTEVPLTSSMSSYNCLLRYQRDASGRRDEPFVPNLNQP